jgi:NADH-quinone oxidoreductase subunit D
MTVPTDERGTSPYDEPDHGAPSRQTTEGRVYTVTGGDWDSLAAEAAESGEGTLVVNMGPQHPSTHGVLRLILELDGETVIESRAGIGYLHTGIEKTCEYRTWVQGTTLVTRMDYLAPLFNEAAFCLATEKLLGITDDVPRRAQLIRVLMMELNRISSHLVCIATGGMEIGALTVMTIGFRERELVLDLFELITGLRLNHAYIRPGGVANDLPEDGIAQIRDFHALMSRRVHDYVALCNENPIFKGRLCDVGYLDLAGCMALGMTGPVLRSTGLPWDLRRTQPYSVYDELEFDVVTWDTCDAYGRFRIRLDEMVESLRIIQQVVDLLEDEGPGPHMIDDPKIAWPAQLSLGPDGLGNSREHIAHIMTTSMEALIHHFKLVTEGFRVPAGTTYVPVESPRGELAVHVTSDGGTRPYRVHMRDPSFNNLQAISAMCDGSQIADVVVAVASIDPVMGGVDR